MKKILLAAVMFIVISLALGVINTKSFNEKAEGNAIQFVEMYFRNKGIKLCYTSNPDVSIARVVVLTESDNSSYYVVMNIKNSLINFTFLNYFIEPIIELIKVDKVQKKNRCGILESMPNNQGGQE